MGTSGQCFILKFQKNNRGLDYKSSLFIYAIMPYMYDLTTLKNERKQANEWLSREYSQIHTGRAAPALLDGVQVEAYGMMQPLKNTASISIEDPKTLRVLPWDKGVIKDVERALHAANLGFSIAVDDSGIRVSIPALTGETREKLVKIAKERLEDARITVRKARESMLNKLKDMDLPEDMLKRARDEVQEIVDEANADLEKTFKLKEGEILS
jgi:ribosome recycling factor